TNTFTPTLTPTLTYTPTITFTPTSTGSATNTPTVTITPTPFSAPVLPNPFTPELSTDNLAHFNLPFSHGAGQLLIGDVRRRPLRMISFQAGQSVQWDGRDDGGRIVSGGVYLYLLNVNGSMLRGTVTVLR
ncbi:MAG TPA: hypothetical protein VIJ93_03550, partial [bacterium]